MRISSVPACCGASFLSMLDDFPERKGRLASIKTRLENESQAMRRTVFAITSPEQIDAIRDLKLAGFTPVHVFPRRGWARLPSSDPRAFLTLWSSAKGRGPVPQKRSHPKSSTKDSRIPYGI